MEDWEKDLVPAKADDWEKDVVPVKEGPGKATAALRGVGQGLTFGFGDEIGAGLQALLTAPKEGFGEALKVYKQARGENRQLDAEAKAARPEWYGAGEIGGGLVTAPLMGGGGLWAQAGKAAAGGAAAGLGLSDASSVDEMAKDTAIGGVVGGGLGAAGYGLAKGAGALFNKLRGTAQKGIEKAGAKAEEMATKEVGEAIASQRGKTGAATQKANRMLENMDRLEPHLSPEQLAELKALEASGGLQKLREKLGSSNLRDLPGASGVVDAETAELASMMANQGTDIAERATDITSGKEALRQVGERAQRYIPPVLGDIVGNLAGQGLGAGLARSAAGAAVGGALGGDWKTAGMGALAGAGLRPAIHSLRRGIQHPAVQTALFSGLKALAPEIGEAGAQLAGRTAGAARVPLLSAIQDASRNNPQALGEWARYFPPDAPEDAQAVSHYTLSQTDPRYVEAMQQLERAKENHSPIGETNAQ